MAPPPSGRLRFEQSVPANAAGESHLLRGGNGDEKSDERGQGHDAQDDLEELRIFTKDIDSSWMS